MSPNGIRAIMIRKADTNKVDIMKVDGKAEDIKESRYEGEGSSLRITLDFGSSNSEEASQEQISKLFKKIS